MGVDEDAKGLVLPDWAKRDALAGYYADDAAVGRIALEVEAALRPDVMMVLLKGVDPASHVLWAPTPARSALATAS